MIVIVILHVDNCACRGEMDRRRRQIAKQQSALVHCNLLDLIKQDAAKDTMLAFSQRDITKDSKLAKACNWNVFNVLMHAAMQLGYILWDTHVGLYNLTKLLDMLIMRILQRKKI